MNAVYLLEDKVIYHQIKKSFAPSQRETKKAALGRRSWDSRGVGISKRAQATGVSRVIIYKALEEIQLPY